MGALLLLGACSAVQQTYGIDADDLSWIGATTSRDEIERRLGAPESAKQRGALSVATYRFDRGYRPPS